MGKTQLAGGPYWSKAWIQKLWEFTNRNFVDFDSGVVDFEALGKEEYEFRKAMFFRNFKNSERAKEAFEEAAKDYKKNVENGKKGGRPSTAPPHFNLTRERGPKSKQEFEEFIYDPANNINTAFAWEWHDIHIARNWTDVNGKPLMNWKGALIKYCKSKENGNA